MVFFSSCCSFFLYILLYSGDWVQTCVCVCELKVMDSVFLSMWSVMDAKLSPYFLEHAVLDGWCGLSCQLLYSDVHFCVAG